MMAKNKSRRNKPPKKKMMVKKRTVDAMNPLDNVVVPPAMRPVIMSLQEMFERRVRAAEFKALKQIQEMKHEIEELKTNQVVVQTLLMEANQFSRARFDEECTRYYRDVIGIVQDGQMQGILVIDAFNIGKSPQSNSLKDIGEHKNPIIVRRA